MPTITSVLYFRRSRAHARIKGPRAKLSGKWRAVAALAALALGPALSGCILGSERPELNLDMSDAYRAAPRGKNRAPLYAAEENATVSRYNREVVTLTTVVTVANSYFQILAAQDEIRVTRQNLAAAERILGLIRNQFNGGTASQLDLSQQEALVAIQRAAIPPLEVTLAQNIDALAVLVARAPANFTVRGGS